MKEEDSRIFAVSTSDKAVSGACSNTAMVRGWAH